MNFQQLKEYLATVPVLDKPVEGEVLILYLGASAMAVSSVLLRENGCQQQPIYYTSQVLQGAEIRYLHIEKIALALVTSAQKLRPYFQPHSVEVRTDQPLKKTLHKPNTSRRMVQWSVELDEFYIRYSPRTAIKAQVLVDFILECTFSGESSGDLNTASTEYEGWLLYVDGSSDKLDSGAGATLRFQTDQVLECTIKFDFPASNNAADYEALILGLQWTRATRADELRVFCDSQLVVK
ncbi:Retrovirus-related Pol polyprotein from transposon 297 family [Quillaja saponaria]|uniref:Retrovirus-related Pol polyprotein from transposon 297 family n=1 Tax=Quillaja saponaria TaxID=32244 RepID=A0AAD7VDN4_QUISA|nr:Retrovirus-related Pol polyprotein from transposon 297 family [Quillaja saponaria]